MGDSGEVLVVCGTRQGFEDLTSVIEKCTSGAGVGTADAVLVFSTKGEWMALCTRGECRVTRNGLGQRLLRETIYTVSVSDKVVVVGCECGLQLEVLLLILSMLYGSEIIVTGTEECREILNKYKERIRNRLALVAKTRGSK